MNYNVVYKVLSTMGVNGGGGGGGDQGGHVKFWRGGGGDIISNVGCMIIYWNEDPFSALQRCVDLFSPLFST